MTSLQGFKAALKLLNGSRKGILMLTDQLRNLDADAQEVVDAIVGYINSVSFPVIELSIVLKSRIVSNLALSLPLTNIIFPWLHAQ